MTWDRPDDLPRSVSKIRADLFDQMWSFVPQLRGYLQHRLSAVEADDVIQDVFLRLCQCAPWQTVEFPKRYLFQVAQAVMIDRRRRAVSRCALMHCELTDGHHPADELSPLRILLAHEEVQAVQTVLKNLPLRTQEIIIAIRLEGATLKSLAARYKISTSAVEKHIGRALRALSSALDEDVPAASTPPAARTRTNRKSRQTRPLVTNGSRMTDRSPLHPPTFSMEMR